jgi:predicted N-acetyltransferase YhbS
MALRIVDQQEADIEEVQRLQYAAFRLKDPGFGRLLFPDPSPSDEYFAAAAGRRREKMRGSFGGRHLKVIDTATDKLIAYGHWELFPDGRTQEKIEKMSSIPPVREGINPEVWNDFYAHLGSSRRELGTQPIAILFTLTTHPDHHRRGAGAMLLERMMEEVDKQGLSAYLESSEMGKPLYEKFGFEEVRTKVFRLEKYGVPGVEKSTIMWRKARSKD